MANRELARFCSEYLSRNPDLKAAMDTIGDPERFAQAMVTAGKKEGCTFAEDDVLAILKTRSQVQELTEDQLEAVAGGSKSKPTSNTEYLQIKMTQVLISSY